MNSSSWTLHLLSSGSFASFIAILCSLVCVLHCVVSLLQRMVVSSSGPDIAFEVRDYAQLLVTM